MYTVHSMCIVSLYILFALCTVTLSEYSTVCCILLVCGGGIVRCDGVCC